VQRTLFTLSHRLRSILPLDFFFSPFPAVNFKPQSVSTTNRDDVNAFHFEKKQKINNKNKNK